MTEEEARRYMMRGLESLIQSSQSIAAELNTKSPSPQKRAALNRKLRRNEEYFREVLTAHLGKEQADLLWVLSQLEAAHSTATPISEN